jgi:hypothetical protein
MKFYSDDHGKYNSHLFFSPENKCKLIEMGDKAGESSSTSLSTIENPVTSSANRHSFFTRNSRNDLFHLQLKPQLTTEEKELLMDFLKVLNLDFSEFNLKLRDLKMSLKAFTLTLKQNLSLLRFPSPKFSAMFLAELISRGLLPETLLEKLDPKEVLAMQNKLKDSIRPSPLTMRPRP